MDKFVSQRTHTRVKYSPLNIHCQLVCLTPMSPCAQSITTIGGINQYEPDRTLTPTAIFPDVRATDPDGIFPNGSSNENLSVESLSWYINNTPIGEIWDASDYVIDVSDSDIRGLLTLKKNIPASEKAVLTFKGVFLDWRTGIKYQVESDEIALVSTDKGSDSFSSSVDKATGEYNTLYDKLLLFDYKEARGLTNIGTRNDYTNGSYEYNVNVMLVKGVTTYEKLPVDIEMRVVDLSTGDEITNATEGVSVNYPTIIIDMRMYNEINYKIEFRKDNALISSTSFGVHKKTSLPVFGKVLRSADLHPGMQVYENSAILNSDIGLVEFPECFYLITWHSQATITENGVQRYAEEKTWQKGEKMLANVSDLGIGNHYNNNHFDVWFDVEPHETLCVLADGNDVLTDENGEVLIG